MGVEVKQTIELTIKDTEGRLWNVKTNATYDSISVGIKFLREIGNVHMSGLEKLLLSYGYEFQCSIINQRVDIEM